MADDEWPEFVGSVAAVSPEQPPCRADHRFWRVTGHEGLRVPELRIWTQDAKVDDACARTAEQYATSRPSWPQP